MSFDVPKESSIVKISYFSSTYYCIAASLLDTASNRFASDEITQTSKIRRKPIVQL
jgi:hypothetical protein